MIAEGRVRVCGRYGEREFVAAFQDCSLPAADFHHAEHLRLVRFYLLESTLEDAAQSIVEGIRRFAAFHGAAEKFHFTLTVAWVRLVALALRRGASVSFEEFLAFNSQLLDKNLPYRYYSPEVLDSVAARTGWVDPDIAPIA